MPTYAQNKSVNYDFHILNEYEVGISLKGSEVKSIRSGAVNLKGSYVKIIQNNLVIENMHVKNFKFSTYDKLDPKRTRQLLMDRRTIDKLFSLAKEKGKSILPLSVYTKNRWIKIKIALCQGKKSYDKRETMKSKTTQKLIDKVKKDYIKKSYQR